MKRFKAKNTTRKIVYSLVLAISSIFIGFWLNTYIVKPDYSFLLFAILKTTCLLLGVLSFLAFTFYIYKAVPNKTINKLSFSLVSLFCFFLLVEILFSFYTPSTSLFIDLSNQIWIKRYAQQKNSLGYRDEEPIPESNKQNVLIVGDSFVEGHGVKYDDMFVNILKEKLKNDYNTFNLGVSGSHTDREFDSLKNYPVNPDVIVLCYYHNDIESAMIKHNFQPNIKNPKADLNKLSKFIVDNSLCINFLFTLNAKKTISRQFMESEQNDIIAYLRDDLWNYQKKSLDQFYNYANKNNTEFIILFFPALSDGIVLTNELAGKRIEHYCHERNICFVNTYPKIKDIPLQNRVANRFDQHPSARVNRIVAKNLYKIIKSP